eukprot:UN01524
MANTGVSNDICCCCLAKLHQTTVGDMYEERNPIPRFLRGDTIEYRHPSIKGTIVRIRSTIVRIRNNMAK